MLLVFHLLAVGVLPGALCLRAPIADRPRREQLPAEERWFWAVAISCTLALVTGLALAAAGSFSFERVVWISLAVSAGLAVVYRRNLRLARARRPGLSVLVPLALLGLCAWLFPPPAEYIIGGKDPGVYMNAGIQIAQRGGLIIEDPLVADVPGQVRGLFFPPYGGRDYRGLRFMGFFITDPDAGLVVDQFPHLYPVAIALGYGMAGLTGARYALPVLASLGVLALYFAGARLAGRAVGATAAALLAIHVVEVWYSRYPNAEMLGQWLLLTGLLAFARAHVDDDWFFAPLAGTMLGLLPFARIDGVPALALVGLTLALVWVRGGRLSPWFLVPLGSLAALFGVYLTRVLAPYGALPRIWLRANSTLVVAGALVAVLLLAGLTWARRRRLGDRLLGVGVPVALVLTVGALAAYAFFVREPGGRLALHDASSLRMFGWYVHPGALAAALIGLALLAPRAFWRDPAFFVVSAGMAVFVFYRLRIVPEHFWLTRRFLMIILPATMLFIAAALVGWQGRPRETGYVTVTLRWGLRLVLLAMVSGSFWTATRAVRSHVEYAGVIGRLESLANRFGPNDLLVVESRNASDLHVLALPLAYIYARPVLVLNTPVPDKALFAAFLGWAERRFDAVYFLGGGGTDLLSRDVGVEPVASERFQVPEFESLRNAYPTRVKRKEFDFGVYRFVEPDADAAGFTLDVGEMDDLHVVRFHAKERDDRGTFRWTGRQSYLSITGITPDHRELVLWMEDGGRPRGAGPAQVEVYVGDVLLGSVTIGGRLAPYPFEIPLRLARAAVSSPDATTVRLVSTTWNPRTSLKVADDRDLGVRLSRVEIRRLDRER